jgi:hypothetical protein
MPHVSQEYRTVPLDVRRDGDWPIGTGMAAGVYDTMRNAAQARVRLEALDSARRLPRHRSPHPATTHHRRDAPMRALDHAA